MSSLFHQYVAQQFHAELKTHLDQLAAAVVLKADGMPALASALSDPRLSRPYSGLYWQIDRVAAAGAPAAPGLLRSRSLCDGLLRVPADVVTDGAIHLHRVPGPDGAAVGLVERKIMLEGAPDAAPITLRLLVAADEQLMGAPVARFSGQLWLALGMLGLGLVVAAVVHVAVGLAPLQRLRRALARLRDGRTQQGDGEFPVEIQPLVNEFISVLGQNAEIVVRARAAGAASVPGTRTSLRPVVDGLVRVMGRVHAARQVDLKVPQMDLGLVFRGEAQDLQEMLGNLLDIACKWARQHVELRATRRRPPADRDRRRRLGHRGAAPGCCVAARYARRRTGARVGPGPGHRRRPGAPLRRAIRTDEFTARRPARATQRAGRVTGLPAACRMGKPRRQEPAAGEQDRCRMPRQFNSRTLRQ